MLEDGKKYKMRAETKEERDLWVKSIIKEQQKLENAQIQKMEAFV